MAQKSFKVTDQAGIHARPASVLVNTATKFSSNVSLTKGDKTINLKSILGIMSTGIKFEDEFTITTEGADEKEALEAIEETLKAQNIAE